MSDKKRLSGCEPQNKALMSRSFVVVCKQTVAGSTTIDEGEMDLNFDPRMNRLMMREILPNFQSRTSFRENGAGNSRSVDLFFNLRD